MARRQKQHENMQFSALNVPTSKPGTEEGKGQQHG